MLGWGDPQEPPSCSGAVGPGGQGWSRGEHHGGGGGGPGAVVPNGSLPPCRRCSPFALRHTARRLGQDIIVYCKFAMRHYSIDDVLPRAAPANGPGAGLRRGTATMGGTEG